MEEFGASSRPVEIRRLVKRGIYRRKRRDVDNTAETKPLPDIGNDDYRAEITFIAENAHIFAYPAHFTEPRTDKAVRIAETLDKSANDDERDEIRHIRTRLNRTFEEFVFYGIKQKREYDRRGE